MVKIFFIMGRGGCYLEILCNLGSNIVLSSGQVVQTNQITVPNLVYKIDRLKVIVHNTG